MTEHQPRLHLLLSAGTEYTTRPDGSPADFLIGTGSRTVPSSLKGISGASVWHVGDLAVPIEKWKERPPRVVGLDTGVDPRAVQLRRHVGWLSRH